MARRFLLLAAIIGLGAAFVAPAAHAEFGIVSFEALTCKSDATAPGLGKPALGPAGGCQRTETERQYTQAAGHPNKGITAFFVNQVTGPPPLPDGFIKDIRVELPQGLGVNPQAVPTCTEKQLSEIIATTPVVLTKCASEAPTSQVGVDYLTTLAPGPAPPAGTEVTIPTPVYNIAPRPGVPSMTGFNASGEPTYLVGELSPVDQHISFNITNLKSPTAGGAPVIGSRLVFEGQAGDGYLTLPSSCAGPQVTKLELRSQPLPTELVRTAQSATPTGADGCANVPFKPTVKTSPEGQRAVDSPNPVTVELGIPFEKGNPTGITNSYLKTAKVTLPEGMGINPSAANGLVACTDNQFHKGTNLAIECPAASQIGTVTVETPSLAPGSIGGAVYVAAPLKNGPNQAGTGEQFRIFIHASGPERGVNVRLVGNVFPNVLTGQLTAVVAENPEAPFSSFQLHFRGGDRGILTSPNTCSPATTTTELTPYSGNLDQNKPSSAFTLASFPTGGACPTTLAGRPFAPAYSVNSDSTAAGKYSPFRVRIARTDGQQELKVVNVTLPKGLTGKLAGIPYCNANEIAAAIASSGTTQKAAPSCPAASNLGTATVAAGSGNTPYVINGQVYLSGPYKGAPLSLVVVTPAVAGPYDLGSVVVRVALNVDPVTAQINAVSDPIPNVFGGVKLDIRNINIDISRSKFMLNPTNCAAGAVAGALNGGGSNPANPAAFSSYPVTAPFQATGCKKLGFKPKLNVKLTGPTLRAKNPKLRAILTARKGDANLARAALTLPHSLFLDQSHIRTICTRVQLAAQKCPKAAIYGHAEAKSPLLSKALKGPVYLVSSNHELPDLLADLRGQVNIQLHGVISSKRGGLKTVFNSAPDVPVSKFTLNMAGGKKSLLVNSTNTCKAPQLAVLNLKGQNGKKVVNKQFGLNIASCGGKGKGNKKK